MVRDRLRSLALVLAAAAFAAPWQANALLFANLVPNPGFDTDLSGWSDGGAGQWSPVDASGAIDSGSALVTNPDTGVSFSIHACIRVAPNGSYDFGASQLTASGQVANGFAQVMLRWYSAVDCTGFLGIASALPSTTVDAWTPLSDTIVSPADARSASIGLFVTKPDGAALDPFSVRFDDVYLAPEPGRLACGLAACVVLAGRSRRPGSGRSGPRRSA